MSETEQSHTHLRALAAEPMPDPAPTAGAVCVSSPCAGAVVIKPAVVGHFPGDEQPPDQTHDSTMDSHSVPSNPLAAEPPAATGGADKHAGAMVTPPKTESAKLRVDRTDAFFAPYVHTVRSVQLQLTELSDLQATSKDAGNRGWVWVKETQGVQVWSIQRDGWRLKGFKLKYLYKNTTGCPGGAVERLWNLLIDMQYYVDNIPGLVSEQLVGKQMHSTAGVYGDFTLQGCGPNDLMILWEEASYPFGVANREALYVQAREWQTPDIFTVTTATIEDNPTLRQQKEGTVRAKMEIISRVCRKPNGAAELTRIVFYDPRGMMPRIMQESKMATELPKGIINMQRQV